MRNWFRSEDGWAVVMGLFIVSLGLASTLGYDLLGWVVSTKEWVDPSLAIAPTNKSLTSLPGWGSLILTYLFLATLLGIGARLIGFNLRRFLIGFAIVFGISFLSWALGHYGYIATTPDKRKTLGLEWSMGLTGEAGYIIALLAGLTLGNFFPRIADWLKEAARPEWFIKTAIIILGAGLGLKGAEQDKLSQAIMLRGLAAIIEAYLIYWAVVYFIARKVFGFSREWSVPLASGISICGVSAAITTGAAIRARPSVPIMVSSLVVIFAVIELLLLPVIAKTFLADQPMVAAAWMGLAVKTDGAAISSGTITESLIFAQAAEKGIQYQAGWMVLTTTTVKVFIDLFIGIWAIVLGFVWAYGIDRKPGAKVPIKEIWGRFPKFVFAYVFTFGLLLALALWRPDLKTSLKQATDQTDLFRRIFFVMTFFSIGLAANFRKLWAEGLGKLALVYFISLFGFVIWVGLLISWLFFEDVMPPIVPTKGS
jgi:uncharacterized membrane protein YadS